MIALLNTPIDVRTRPEDLERIRRNLVEAVAELQRSPLAAAKLVTDVVLVDSVPTPIPHNFGRRARVFITPPQSAVLVEEVRDSDFHPSKFVVLMATIGDTVVDVVLA